MSIKSLVYIKNILLVMIFILLLLGLPYVIDKEGNTIGIPGAFLIAIIFVGAHVFLWSNLFYNKCILSHKNIEYNYFVKFGLGVIITTSFFPLGSIYNHFFQGNLNVIHILIVIVVMYFVINKIDIK